MIEMKVKRFSSFLTLTCAVVLSGCSLLPGSDATPALPDPTSIYQTISAQLTASAQPAKTGSLMPATTAVTPTLLLKTLTPQADISSTTIPPSPAPPCDQASAGRPSIDISVPDGTQFQPGQSFTKTWRLVNSGACSWTRDYAVVWFSGETLGKIISLPFTKVIQPGQSVDVSVDFTAPQSPGIHQSNWMLRNTEGKLFGLGPASSGPFWVRIEVLTVRTNTSTPLPTFTLTPTLAVAARGSLTLSLDKGLDLDSGKLVTDPTTDLGLQEKLPAGFLLTPLNGAVIAQAGNTLPTLAICKAAELKIDPITLGDALVNTFLCYRTNKSLPGYALIKSFDLKEKKLTLEFTTWSVP